MSNQTRRNDNEERRVTSIAHKLHGQMVGTRLGLNFAANIFLFAALSVMWIVMKENEVLGEIVPKYDRNFTTRGEGLSNLVYVVSSGDKVLMEEKCFIPLLYILGAVLVAVVFQLMNLMFSYYGDYKKIKKTLNPINEIALKADELNKISFDDSKFHTIENAIEHISPSQTQELSLGDPDLQGIEAAMNNMISKMHDTYMQQARFVNDASHELRTPIAVIQGYANMLDRWGKEDEEILDESITAIKNESDHMNHLVEQLLFLARGDAGRNVMTFEDVCLNDIMREIYEESLMIDENHVYKYNDNNPDLHINADASMIKQAMRILVDNASKYTEKGDEIVLSAGIQEDGHKYIQVQDTGIGMAAVDVKHMFERFYRADDTRKVQGTGLGLSIAKWIVDKHKGHFEILSRKELGTRIRIVFDEII